MLLEHGTNCGITDSAKLVEKVSIGQGSFGKVWRANHVDWGPVAYKQLAENEYIDEAYVISNYSDGQT